MTGPAIDEQDRCRVTDIIHRYFWLADHGQAEKIAECFARNGRLTFGQSAPNPGTLEAAQIASAMLARSKQTHVTTRHIVSNIVLRARNANTIEASSLLTLYRSEDASRDSYPKSIADVDDVFVREGDDWRIAQRTIDPIFNRP